MKYKSGDKITIQGLTDMLPDKTLKDIQNRYGHLTIKTTQKCDKYPKNCSDCRGFVYQFCGDNEDPIKNTGYCEHKIHRHSQLYKIIINKPRKYNSEYKKSKL